jgi:hypothetical protein
MLGQPADYIERAVTLADRVSVNLRRPRRTPRPHRAQEELRSPPAAHGRGAPSAAATSRPAARRPDHAARGRGGRRERPARDGDRRRAVRPLLAAPRVLQRLLARVRRGAGAAGAALRQHRSTRRTGSCDSTDSVFPDSRQRRLAAARPIPRPPGPCCTPSGSRWR